MKDNRILVLPGDGIGPEVIAEAVKLIECITDLESRHLSIHCQYGLVGAAALAQEGIPLPPATLALARQCDAILLGSVGGMPREKFASHLRPEQGLLQIRKDFDLFANLRPAVVFPGMEKFSSLKYEKVSGLDLMIVRELTGGIYFGKPRKLAVTDSGLRFALNSAVYNEAEVERIAHTAFKMAESRTGRLCSVDKANVLEVSELWREVVERLSTQYPRVQLSHLYVDNAAMQLAQNPKQFDVILSSNLFGDILSDLAASVSGSIGLLPSASINQSTFGMYEPVHGAAFDLAGKNIANPVAAVLSLAMLLRLSLNLPKQAAMLEAAVKDALSRSQTTDLTAEDPVSTSQMGDRIVSSYTDLFRKS